jgi:DNA-binding IclR family transcriptional regulator
MDLVTANPGIHLMEIVRRTGISKSNVQHHLATLVRLGLLTEVQGPRFTCYHATGQVDQRIARAAPYLKPEGARLILDALRAGTGMSLRDLAERTHLAAPTVHYHLQRLEQAGLATARRDGRSPLWSATPLAAQASELSAVTA